MSAKIRRRKFITLHLTASVGLSGEASAVIRSGPGGISVCCRGRDQHRCKLDHNGARALYVDLVHLGEGVLAVIEPYAHRIG